VLPLDESRREVVVDEEETVESPRSESIALDNGF
jgi:hypothetical protein